MRDAALLAASPSPLMTRLAWPLWTVLMQGHAITSFALPRKRPARQPGRATGAVPGDGSVADVLARARRVHRDTTNDIGEVAQLPAA